MAANKQRRKEEKRAQKAMQAEPASIPQPAPATTTGMPPEQNPIENGLAENLYHFLMTTPMSYLQGTAIEAICLYNIRRDLTPAQQLDRARQALDALWPQEGLK